MFVRFSTVAGERGSFDLARDVRGFAVKFYTDEGNFDLVGNNMPVFFIQDAIKFPDLVHAVKPEPHHGMPQAASAHDTFWDFVSLMPESTHMLMWLMSDRALPRSFTMMQGFGVHTFRFVNAAGESRFVKFHWNPVRGTHSLDWDECVKINGADPDYHRRDLWESIEAGHFPEWELGLQVFAEKDADGFSFDVLDPTKIVPEELVPVRTVGRLVLNRNPDNFFAETEQVAFCAAHLVPGIDFSNDPLLAGRIHSYQDTQISRLGGPNFHEIPINSPVAQVHNAQRDGMHRQAIHRGPRLVRAQLARGRLPVPAGQRGRLHLVPRRGAGGQGARQAREVRRPLHAGDAVLGEPVGGRAGAHHPRLPVRAHEGADPGGTRARAGAARERERRCSRPRSRGASGSRCPSPLPLAVKPAKPEVTRVAGAVALRAARRGRGSRDGRWRSWSRAGVDGDGVMAVHRALTERGAVPRIVAARLGPVASATGDALDPDATLETMPSCLFDAVVVPDGEASAAALAAARAGGRVREGSVPPLQDHPRRRRGPGAPREGGPVRSTGTMRRSSSPDRETSRLP